MSKTYNLRSKGLSAESMDPASQRPTSSNEPSTVQQTVPSGDTAGKPDLTLADLHKTLTDFSAIVCIKLDAIQTNIAVITNKVNDLEKAAEDNSAHILDIEKRTIPELERKFQMEIKGLKDKLTLAEIYQRKSNLLFYGVKQKKDENVFEVLRETFVYIGLTRAEADEVAFVNAHRLPQKKSTEGVPQPIIAKMVYMNQRNRILSAFESKRTPMTQGQERARISVRTDLPPALKEQRNILAKTAFNLRRQKKLSTKIVVEGVNVVLYWKEKESRVWQVYKD